MNTVDKIKIMQAFVDGKKIESAGYNAREITGWEEDLEPLWDWCSEVYRIKPEPKIIYVNEYGAYNDAVSYVTEKDARLGQVLSYGEPDRRAIPYIELTDEIKEKLNIK